MRAIKIKDESTPETLTSQLYDRLRGDIISGSLKPGARLKVEHLRALYDTGASAVREALSLLTSDGLVQRLENRGFRVAPASNDDFQDLLNTRCWIEERALREAMAHGGAEWEDSIVLSHYRLSREPRAADSR